MPAVLNIAARSGAFLNEFEDGGRSYVIKYQWTARLGAWYVDILDADDGSSVARGRRVTPGGLVARLPSGGTLYGAGTRDPYAFEDLGRGLFVAIEFAGEEV